MFHRLWQSYGQNLLQKNIPLVVEDGRVMCWLTPPPQQSDAQTQLLTVWRWTYWLKLDSQ